MISTNNNLSSSKHALQTAANTKHETGKQFRDLQFLLQQLQPQHVNEPEDDDTVEEVSPIQSHDNMRLKQLRQSLASYQKGNNPHMLTGPHGRNPFIPDPDTLDERQLMDIFTFLDQRDQPFPPPHITTLTAMRLQL